MSGETHITYAIAVDSFETPGGEYEPERMVDGCIDLMASGKWRLERRLTALKDAGLIGEWSIERYEPPSLWSETGVLNFIAGIGEDRDEEIVRVWNEASA